MVQKFLLTSWGEGSKYPIIDKVLAPFQVVVGDFLHQRYGSYGSNIFELSFLDMLAISESTTLG